MLVGGDENARFQFSDFASMEIVYTFLILFMFNYPTETAAYDMMQQLSSSPGSLLELMCTYRLLSDAMLDPNSFIAESYPDMKTHNFCSCLHANYSLTLAILLFSVVLHWDHLHIAHRWRFNLSVLFCIEDWNFALVYATNLMKDFEYPKCLVKKVSFEIQNFRQISSNSLSYE